MRSVNENRDFIIAAMNAHFTDGNSYVKDKGNGVIEINDEEGKLNPFFDFCAEQLANSRSEYYRDYFDESAMNMCSWQVIENGLKNGGIKKESTLALYYINECDGNKIYG